MAAYPFTVEDDRKTDLLMAELQKVRKREEQILKELRAAIYKIEKPR